MKQGTVKWFNKTKGFGFLTDGVQDYFVHVKQIANSQELFEGQRVSLGAEGVIALEP